MVAVSACAAIVLPEAAVNVLAVKVKSSAPAILMSIWSSVSAVILVSASASKINSFPFKSIPLLGNNLPASLPSMVKKVVSAPPSVPLNIISVSSPCASIVIFPALVAKVDAASPVAISSKAVAVVGN